MIAVVPHSAPAAQQVSTSVPVNSAYVVKPGDHLWSIAKHAEQGNWQAGPGYPNTILAKAS
jgi:hypothetical protein